ncbi:hypothetical protein ACQJBY_054283 [Aegilops geniculata]
MLDVWRYRDAGRRIRPSPNAKANPSAHFPLPSLVLFFTSRKRSLPSSLPWPPAAPLRMAESRRTPGVRCFIPDYAYEPGAATPSGSSASPCSAPPLPRRHRRRRSTPPRPPRPPRPRRRAHNPETGADATEYDYVTDDPSPCTTEEPGKPPLDHQISPTLFYTACIRVV